LREHGVARVLLERHLCKSGFSAFPLVASPASRVSISGQLGILGKLPWFWITLGNVVDFYEAPGNIHLLSGSASTTRPARILAMAFGEKGREITKPL